MCDEDEVSTMDVRVRMGDAIDPFQLANGVEAVIGDEYQEWSSPLSLMLTIQTIHARCDRASDECEGNGTIQGCWLIVSCMSELSSRISYGETRM